MHVRARIAGGVLLAVALLLTAAVLWVGETNRGWFAYGPLSDHGQNLVVMTGRRELALIVGTAGLALLAFLSGFAIGRRPGQGGSQ